MKRFRRILSMLLAAAMLMTIMPFAAFAAVDLSDPNQVVSVHVNVTYGQTEARKMLEYINNFRTGKTDGPGGTTNPPQMLDKNGSWVDCPDLQPMTYDYKLEEIAMQRAAEIAIRFAHERPNGKKCSSAFSSTSLTFYGENIAAGNDTALDTFLQWREDDLPYSGQGHRRNMLRADNLAVGIGHAEYQGHHFWVQEFAPAARKQNKKTKANNALTAVPVEIKAGLLQTGDAAASPAVTLSAATLEVPFGGSVKAPNATFAFYLKDVWPEMGSSYGDKSHADLAIVWKSDDPNIAAVEKGKVMGVAPGTTRLTGSFLGELLAVDVTVKCDHAPAENWENDASDHWHTCTRCGVPLDKATHTFGDWVVTQPATCTQPGVQTRTCTVCGKVETGAVPAAGHTLAPIARVEPACDQPGTEGYFTCAVCGGLFADPAGTTPIEQPVVLPALGHDWNEPVYTFAEDSSACTAQRTCKRNPAHVETAAAAVTSAQTKAPTCTQPGETTYTAAFAETWAAPQTKVIANIPATGVHTFGEWTDKDGENHVRVCTGCQQTETAPHTFGEWTVVTEATESKTGLKKRSCSVCGREETAEIPVKAHTHKMTPHTAKAATCTEAGNVAYWHCDVCNKNFSDEKGTSELAVVTIAALGHDWSKPVYTWDKEQTTCIAQRTCKRDKTHVETATAKVTSAQTKTPTCTQPGETTITAEFAEKWAETQTKVTANIPATGKHTFGKWTDLDGTNHKRVCTSCQQTETAPHTFGEWTIVTEATESKTGLKKRSCPVCGREETMEIPVKEHTHKLTAVPAKAATCTEKGNVAYWHCDVCGKNFADDKAAKEIADITTAALGHDWDATVYEWSADGKTCTAKRICKRDKTHAETAAAKVTAKETTGATCTEKGKITYTAAFAEDWAKPQTRVAEGAAATGHDWGETVYEWSADGKTCTAKRICKRDKTHVETAAGKVVSAQSKAPTCAAAGETTYAAVFDVAWAQPQAKVLADVPHLPHTLTHYPQIDSTCVKQGVAEHWTCAVCHKLFADAKAEKETSAEALRLKLAEHKWTGWQKDAANHWKSCTVCGTKAELAAHSYTETVTRQPTNTQTGIKTYTCKVCGHSYTREIPAIPATPTYDWLPAYAAIAAQKPGGKVTIDVGHEIAVPNGVWQAFYGKDITVTLKRGLDNFVFNGLDLEKTGFDPDNGHNLTDLTDYIGRKYPKPTPKPTKAPATPEPPAETAAPTPTVKPAEPTPAATEKPAQPQATATPVPTEAQPGGFNWIWLLLPLALAAAVAVIIIFIGRGKHDSKH